MNTRLTTLFIACLGMVGSYGFALDTPTTNMPSTEAHRTESTLQKETINQYKTMDKGMFQDQNFNKTEVKNNLDELKFAKYRVVLKNDPVLVRFVDVVHFSQSGDTLVITGTVDSEATKAKIESAVKAVPGVEKVDNQLIVK